MQTIIEIGRKDEDAAHYLVARCNEKTVRVSMCDNTISRTHCRVVIDGDTMLIENVSSANVLYVNGQEYLRKNITLEDNIALGVNKTSFNLKAVYGVLMGFSISHLQTVWYDFENAKSKARKMEKLKGRLGSIPTYVMMGLCAISGTAAGLSDGVKNTIGMMRWAVPLLFVGGMIAYEMLTNNSAEQKIARLAEKFQNDYVCPSCGNYLNIPWNLLSKKPMCPHCKAKFISGDIH